MKGWREQFLQRAIDAGFLSQSEARRLHAADVDDARFIDAILPAGEPTDAELAELEGMIGPELLSSVYAERSLRSRRITSPPPGDEAPIIEGLPTSYRVVRKLDEGGMGTVYEAYEPDLNRRVAIKVAKQGADRRMLGKVLQRERRIISALDHPHIVTILTAGRLADGAPYFVMSLVDGVTLQAWLTERQRGVREIVTLIESVARAVGTAHMLGVVHRDLTPRNIMVTTDGQPKILDFGLATGYPREDVGVEATLPRSSDLFAGHVVGTRGHMSPEQRDGRTVGPPSDVYALGVVLASLLSGGSWRTGPTRQGSTTTPLSTATAGRPQLPSVGREVRAILRKCLADEPSQRYATAMELADDLKRWLEHYPVEALIGFRPWYSLRKLARRRPVATLATVLLVVAAVVTPLLINRERRAAEAAAAREAQARVEAELQSHVAATQRDRAETELLRDGLDGARQRQQAGDLDGVLASLNRVPYSRRGWEWYRIHHETQMAPAPRRVIAGHDWGVMSMLIAPDGSRLISSGADGCLVATDTATCEAIDLARGSWSEQQRAYRPLLTMPNWSDPDIDCYLDLAWIEPGQSLVAAGHSGRAYVWSVSEPAARTLLTSDSPLTAVAVAEDGDSILFGNRAGRLILTDRDGREMATNEAPDGEITDIAALCGAWIVGDANGTIRILAHDLASEYARWNEAGSIFCLDYSAATRRLAVAADVPTVSMYLLSEDGRSVADHRVLVLPALAIATSIVPHVVRWSDDGGLLLAGDSHGRLIAWEVEDWRLRFYAADQEEPGWRTPSEERLPFIATRTVTSIVLGAEQRRAYTAGRDGTVKQWNMAPALGVRYLQTAAEPRIAFGPEGEILWSLGSDGRLVAWNVEAGTEIASLAVVEGTDTGLLAATPQGDVVAVAAKNDVSLWRWSGERITAVGRIDLPDVVAAVAVDSHAHRVASYLSDDTLIIWDTATGKEIVRRTLRDAGVGTARGAVLHFTCDDARLVVAGPRCPLSILDARSLQLVERPNVFAGQGGTALDCDPVRAERIVGADTIGRILVYPEPVFPHAAWHQSADQVIGKVAVAAVAFTPDGRRIGAINDDGLIATIEPDRLGVVWTSQSTVQAAATGLDFDPASRYLAIAHVDGTVELWDTSCLDVPPVESPRPWRVTTLLEGPRAIDIAYCDSGVTLDEAGQPLLVCSRQSSPQPGDEPPEYTVNLGHVEGGRLVEIIVEVVGRLPAREHLSLRRTLACALAGDRALVSFRRPRLDLVAGAGQLVLHEIALPLSSLDKADADSDAPGRSTLGGQAVALPGNNGFSTWLLPDGNDEFMLLHFSHRGHYLQATRRGEGAVWRTTTIGRQGDGLHVQAAPGGQGQLFAYFRPTRYNGDKLPNVCLTLDAASLETIRREVPDPAADMTKSVIADRDGQPVVLYRRRAEHTSYEYIVARRANDGTWRHEIVAVDPAWRVHPSNLQWGPDDRLRIAMLDTSEHRLLLLTERETGWTSEVLWSAQAGEMEDPVRWLAPVLRIDPTGRPLVLLGHRSLTHGWLRLIEPVE